MRRHWPPRALRTTARLATRLDRAADRINPYLAALAIGLMVLDFTCFLAIKVMPPKPMDLDAPVSAPPAP